MRPRSARHLKQAPKLGDVGLDAVRRRGRRPDATVMAFSEQHELPILTFDFEHVRATRPARGYWRLVIDETRYREMTA